MKRLQKAVHRKETNVSQEKQDFEEARKDLELRLRDVKLEIESMSNPPQNEAGGEHMSNNLSEGARSSVPNGSVNAQVTRYQNKAPHTLTGRNASTNLKRQ